MQPTFKLIWSRLDRRDRASTTINDRSFANDERGSIVLLFSLMLFVVFVFVGGAVDYARWLAANTRTIQAMDAAVIAGGRQLLIGKPQSEAIITAQQFYSRNKARTLSEDSVVFNVVDAGTKMVAVSDSAVKTTMLSIAGIPELRIRRTATAFVQVGAGAEQDIEISLMLDTTGSMAGSKMVALKQAALDLINITVWADQSEFTSKVAIVPFAPYVNPGRDAFELATNYSPNGNSDNRTCVKERNDATNRYTDATPNSNNGYFKYYRSKSACKPQATILPLSNDKQKITQRINEMQPTGTTAGHIGTAWAWYVLSPNFADLWPTGSKPKPYSMLTELNAQGRPKVMKIAVLMTDGEYNAKYSGASSSTQARAQCASMKAAGIQIYTVGFGISSGGQADTTLSLCASEPNNYYSAQDGDALRSAFRDIAMKIATLRLTQ